MKKTLSVILCAMAMTAAAQTLDVTTGNVTYRYNVADCGEMVYSDNGTKLTIAGKTFSLADISEISSAATGGIEDNAVYVTYSASAAKVLVSGNVAANLTVTENNADLSIVQDANVKEEITYTLSGTCADGSFYHDGDIKATFVFNNLNLTNPTGCAFRTDDGKRIAVEIEGSNALADGAGSTDKAAMMVNGHTEFTGSGTLSIAGNYKHAFWGDEYVLLKKTMTGTINITKSVKDGMNVNQYLKMKGGTLNISGTIGDDGIQVGMEGDKEENDGKVIVENGVLAVRVTADAARAVKADSTIVVSGGTLNLSTSGGVVYDSDDAEYKGSSCLKSDVSIEVSGGSVYATSSGTGGKGISCDGKIDISGGDVTVKVTGSNYGSSSTGGGFWNKGGSSSGTSKSAKGMKSDGNMTISGGTVSVTASSHEAIETKGTLNISGGTIYAQSSDDAINSSSHMTITGGLICAYSTGNDGLDANGNMYVKGGTIYAICSGSPEVALDANTEGGYKLYVTGGNIIAVGGLESGSELTQACYKASSWNKSTWYALYNGSTPVVAFKTPSAGGSGIVVSTSSTSALKSGVTTSGGTSQWNGMGVFDGTISGGSTVSLSSYSSGGSGTGGFGPGGGGHGW